MPMQDGADGKLPIGVKISILDGIPEPLALSMTFQKVKFQRCAAEISGFLLIFQNIAQLKNR